MRRTDARPDARLGHRWWAYLAALALLLVFATGCDWYSFGYDAAHTRFNSTENTIGAGNVGAVSPAWGGLTGGTIASSPAIASGVVYVGSSDGKLYAFDEAGSTNCNTTLQTCNPLWTASIGNGGGLSPAVVNGVVFTASSSVLYAFDAAGTTNCAGTPKTCTPLWTSPLANNFTESPSVSGGVVYIHSGNSLYAIDAAGSTGCSGAPKVCAPLWTGPVSAFTGAGQSSPVIASGLVYAPGGGSLSVFDAAGSVGCSGTPKVCVPLWTTSTGAYTAAVAGGRLFVDYQFAVYTFDAAGSTSCQGIPKVCSPLWSYTTNGQTAAPAIAGGVLYIGGPNSGNPKLLAAFDATGSTGCSGTPKVCAPLWTSTSGGGNATDSSPAIANGVAFIGSFDGNVYAFDATGSTGCSGTPKVCSPLWSSQTNGFVHSSPAVANGAVIVGSDNHSLYAFK